jgi:hypothetical protein
MISPGAFLDQNINDAIDLLEHDEWGESFLLICTQLYEYDVSISRSTYDSIREIGLSMKLDESNWQMLEELIS